MNDTSYALEVRTVGVRFRKIRNEDPLEITGVGCDTTVRLEFLHLFSFPDDSANFESAFESENQRLKSNISGYTGDLGTMSNHLQQCWRGALTRMRSPAMMNCSEEVLMVRFLFDSNA